MSTKTLNAVQVFHAPAPASKRLTYSVSPAQAPLPVEETAATLDLNAFLENENPLGCIRGVFWVMAFNATVFLIGFTVWASVRHLR